MSETIGEVLTVVIADDHSLIRSGLRNTLNSFEGFAVVSEASTGDEAVRVATELRPDVVVLDIQMPGLNGVEAARQIVAVGSSTAVLMLTMFEDDESVFAALRAGARGYVVKGSSEEDVVRAIRAVAAGEAIFSAAIASRIRAHFATDRPGKSGTLFPELSAREHEVLDLVARGEGNKAIARQLSVSPKTVSNHVANILMKLQAASRSEVIVRAREAGMGRRSRKGRT